MDSCATGPAASEPSKIFCAVDENCVFKSARPAAATLTPQRAATLSTSEANVEPRAAASPGMVAASCLWSSRSNSVWRSGRSWPSMAEAADKVPSERRNAGWSAVMGKPRACPTMTCRSWICGKNRSDGAFEDGRITPAARVAE
jgi:hypothetical protein